MTNFPQSSSNHPTNLELHFTQISTINGSTIINISDQIVEGCVSQQQRHALTPITVAWNDNVWTMDKIEIYTIELILFHRI